MSASPRPPRRATTDQQRPRDRAATLLPPPPPPTACLSLYELVVTSRYLITVRPRACAVSHSRGRGRPSHAVEGDRYDLNSSLMSCMHFIVSLHLTEI